LRQRIGPDSDSSWGDLLFSPCAAGPWAGGSSRCSTAGPSAPSMTNYRTAARSVATGVRRTDRTPSDWRGPWPAIAGDAPPPSDPTPPTRGTGSVADHLGP